MRISTRILALIGLLAIPCVSVLPARSQELTRERVPYALDRTDERIERAQGLVAGSDNVTAEAEVALAVRIQADAKSAFTANQLRLAMDLTFRARGHADRAIALIRGLPDPDRVRTQLDRTRELIERGRDRIEECDNDRAPALLRVALEMQGRAEGAAGDGRYLGALQLTLGARERMHRALRLCRLEENLKESCARALARTDEVIARARDAITEREGGQARSALVRAEQLQTDAQAQFHGERFDVSLRLTQSAQAMAHRAIRLSRSGT